jgi:hypothetical protein
MTLIRLHAGSVRFYYDRFLLEADGDVRITTSDGMTMRGDAFSMDLKLNRFLLAGHVHVSDPAGAQDGAAIADYLDFNRIYLIPITGEPDRWTFSDGDFAHPIKGREMPGDTFFFPDLGKSKPFLIAGGAVVGSRSFVRFNGNRLDVANGLGAYVPAPTYYINFSTNRHLGENSLAGANFDATWEVAGSQTSITAVHFRYDTVNKTFASLEQHFSSAKSYAVFSINPMTRPQKFWDLVLSDQPSPTFQVKTFTQLATNQRWLTRPDASGQFSIVQVIKALPHSSMQLAVQDTNSSLLPPGTYDGVKPIIDHPWQLALSASGNNYRIAHTPFYERFTYGAGYAHDTFRTPDNFGLQHFDGRWYTTIWNGTFDFLTYLPAFKLGNSDVENKNYYLNASYERTRQWYSTPHYVDSTLTRISISKVLGWHFTSFLGYSVYNVGDIYGSLQALAYPPRVPVVGGVKYPGYAAFRGLATWRTLSLGVNYFNSGNVSWWILGRAHDDFPKPIPNYFSTPPLDNLGNPIQGEFYLGQPPYDVTADVRARVNAHMTIDLERAYYFHYGSRGWSPEFVIQVLP